MKDEIVGTDFISKGIFFKTVGEAELRARAPKPLPIIGRRSFTGLFDTGRDVIVNSGSEVSRLMSVRELIGSSRYF